MISMVLILPAALQIDGNAIAVALSHDIEPGQTYSVALSASGQTPATHYGCRTWARPGFVAMVEIARTGVVPDGTHPDIAAVGLGVRATYPDVMAALIADARETDDPYPHWTDVLAANGLHVITQELLS